jgi:hypothetical protein
MSGAVIIAVTIVACIFGYVANSIYENKYGTPAVNWAMIVIQCVFMLCALLTFPNPDITGWFILWCLLLTISYVLAIVVCWQECLKVGATQGDKVLAILAQTILPLGMALLIIAVMVLIFGGSGNKKKK